MCVHALFSQMTPKDEQQGGGRAPPLDTTEPHRVDFGSGSSVEVGGREAKLKEETDCFGKSKKWCVRQLPRCFFARHGCSFPDPSSSLSYHAPLI